MGHDRILPSIGGNGACFHVLMVSLTRSSRRETLSRRVFRLLVASVVGLSLLMIAHADTRSCDCSHQCDWDLDGFLTALDLASEIDVLFAGKWDPWDPLCGATITDFDGDGFATVLDLGKMIDHLFAGGDGPCDLCNPTQSSCAP